MGGVHSHTEAVCLEKWDMKKRLLGIVQCRVRGRVWSCGGRWAQVQVVYVMVGCEIEIL